MTNLGFGLLETHGTETQACTGLIKSDSLLNITDTDMISPFLDVFGFKGSSFSSIQRWLFPSADQHVPIGKTSPPPAWPKRCPWLELVAITLHLEVEVFPRFDKSFKGHLYRLQIVRSSPGFPTPWSNQIMAPKKSWVGSLGNWSGY